MPLLEIEMFIFNYQRFGKVLSLWIWDPACKLSDEEWRKRYEFLKEYNRELERFTDFCYGLISEGPPIVLVNGKYSSRQVLHYEDNADLGAIIEWLNCKAEKTERSEPIELNVNEGDQPENYQHWIVEK